MEKIILKSVKEELADCREACKNVKIGDMMNFLHHEEPIEPLTFDLDDRLKYIFIVKSTAETPEEIALRFRMLRPVKVPEPSPFEEEFKTLSVLAQTIYALRQEYNKNGVWETNKAGDYYHAVYSAERETSKIREKYLKGFSSLFGTDWYGSIFSTFHPEKNHE